MRLHCNDCRKEADANHVLRCQACDEKSHRKAVEKAMDGLRENIFALRPLPIDKTQKAQDEIYERIIKLIDARYPSAALMNRQVFHGLETALRTDEKKEKVKP